MSEHHLRTLGLLGGMSWESTLPYYRLINQTVRERLGGLHSARLLLYSVDFAEVERLQHAGDWDAAGALLGSSRVILSSIMPPALTRSSLIAPAGGFGP